MFEGFKHIYIRYIARKRTVEQSPLVRNISEKVIVKMSINLAFGLKILAPNFGKTDRYPINYILSLSFIEAQ